METEPVTHDAFYARIPNDTRRLPETVEVLALDLDVGVRFKDHKHTSPPSNPSMCTLGNTLQASANRHGIKVATRHDGPDLIVFRLK